MKVHFTGESSARNPTTVMAGLVLSAVGLCFAYLWIPDMFEQLDMGHMVGALCASLFIIVFFGGGLFLLVKAAQNQKTILLITTEGISYGERIFRWEDITEIGIMEKYTGRKDLYCTTQSNPYVVELLLSRGLSSEHTAVLFGALRNEIIPLHRHILLKDDSG